ncbi:GNAT family N-acetyltransferase [Thiohalocapsa sp.]|uniref:GNAT family N-acetyltransferase n=1 Tax=Thiohalocapsa sp. TaxID=2497641 RepID=UPI0025D3BBDC|nr:GNAT family N-acetyltransferase [Thiohalocapsa sp.]
MPDLDLREVVVRPLDRADDRSAFSCGNVELDRFFQRYAGQNQFRHHIGTTYIALVGDRLLGFVTVSPGELAGETVSEQTCKRLPTYPLPILRMSRLAVDLRAQGQGVGKLLLRFALKLALELRERFGCVGVVVDAKAEAVDFYRKLGFRPLTVLQGALGDRPEPLPMFLAARQIAALLG